jgi:radical SAM superfamily enzyme YgiQ (UPF0313 family)
MKITFIHPNMFSRPSADAMEPLVFSILTGLTPPDVELILFDDRVEAINFDEPTDLVAMTVQTFTARRAYKIAERYKQRGIPVVMGGFHPTLLPNETLKHADAIAIGDAESTWPKIVADAKKKTLKSTYLSESNLSLDGIKPDHGILKDKKYTAMIPIQFGRGCRFSCDFCSVHSFYGKTLRNRPIDDVIDEIKKRNKKFFFFVDDNLFRNYDKVLELFEKMIPLKIKWACQLSLDAAYNTKLLELLQKSGCIAVFVGFESLNPDNLKQMKKGGNLKHKDYKEGVKRFKDYGIMVCGAFVFGYDQDTQDTINRALEFALESKLCIAHFNPLFPTPQTPLYVRLKEEQRLICDPWWLAESFRYGQGFFHPRGMSVEELSEKCFEARCIFNRYSNIAKRAMDFKANSKSLFHLSSFLAANFISRKEIYRRQGSQLG